MTNEMTREQRDEAIQDGVVGAVMGQMAKHGVSFEIAHARALAAQEARRQDWLSNIIDHYSNILAYLIICRSDV